MIHSGISRHIFKLQKLFPIKLKRRINSVSFIIFTSKYKNRLSLPNSPHIFTSQRVIHFKTPPSIILVDLYLKRQLFIPFIVQSFSSNSIYIFFQFTNSRVLKFVHRTTHTMPFRCANFVIKTENIILSHIIKPSYSVY